MKVTFWKAMQWWKKAKEEKKELSTLSITIEEFIPEENGPALNLEIEIRNIEQSIMEMINTLCARQDDVAFRCSIEEIEEEP